ncbi:MAG: pyridoxamine 5'-phosphate oxidase family protein [Deltaproteobacteria bacterium]|nr:pyridoxamine 5'-phosphate oxidase family protein [Deltaproteobacteria bacterium]
MDRSTIAAFLAKQTLAVEASTAEGGQPQAAVVAIVSNDRFEVLFETPVATRKVENLRRDPRVALVVWEGLTTLQYEGVIDEPTGEELEPLLQLLFARFPDARARAGSVTYLRARPTWVRYSPLVDGKPVQIELTSFA